MNIPTVKAVQQRSLTMTLQKYGRNELSLSEIIFYVNNLKLENTSRSTKGILKTFKNKLATMYFRPLVCPSVSEHNDCYHSSSN